MAPRFRSSNEVWDSIGSRLPVAKRGIAIRQVPNVNLGIFGQCFAQQLGLIGGILRVNDFTGLPFCYYHSEQLGGWRGGYFKFLCSSTAPLSDKVEAGWYGRPNA